MIVPFGLEDFFYEYEHDANLANLASSDALPWTAAELEAEGIALPDIAKVILNYPDVRGQLLPVLETFCALPSGMEVLPTSGGAEAIALILNDLAALFTSRERCVLGLPVPAFGAFHGLASLLQLPVQTYSYAPARSWCPDRERLLALSTTCAAVVITNPHNPTGHVLPQAFLQQIADRLTERDALLIVDEVFKIRDEGVSANDLKGNVIVLGSLSKTYGLPGLRFGWIVAQSTRLRRLRTLQQYLTLSLNGLTVAIARAALAKPDVLSRGAHIRTNRQIVREWALALDGVIDLSPSQGGTTACVTVSASGVSEQRLFDKLKKSGVLLAPGVRCFEFDPGPCWMRLGYGGDTSVLRSGLLLVESVLRRFGASVG